MVIITKKDETHAALVRWAADLKRVGVIVNQLSHKNSPQCHNPKLNIIKYFTLNMENNRH